MRDGFDYRSGYAAAMIGLLVLAAGLVYTGNQTGKVKGALEVCSYQLEREKLISSRQAK